MFLFFKDTILFAIWNSLTKYQKRITPLPRVSSAVIVVEAFQASGQSISTTFTPVQTVAQAR